MTNTDQKLLQIISFLKDKYIPIRLFLYGSRAHGNYRTDSDYDFVMVLSNFESKNPLPHPKSTTLSVGFI